jgi:predicted nucleotidyltransferase
MSTERRSAVVRGLEEAAIRPESVWSSHPLGWGALAVAFERRGSASAWRHGALRAPLARVARLARARYVDVMAHLSPLERIALDRYAAAARARFGERLVALSLFGSRARGEGRDDSDLDVLVVVRALSREERRRTIDDATDVGLDLDLVLSPLVVEEDAWRASPPIAAEIAREGIGL